MSRIDDIQQRGASKLNGLAGDAVTIAGISYPCTIQSLNPANMPMLSGVIQAYKIQILKSDYPGPFKVGSILVVFSRPCSIILYEQDSISWTVTAK